MNRSNIKPSVPARGALLALGITLVACGGGGGGGSSTTPPVNVPPVASFTKSAPSGTAPLDVTFASTASDSDGSIASFLWTFGSDGTSTVQNPAHTFNSAGSYSVTLRVTDNSGASATSAAQVVTVTANTPPVSSFTKSTSGGVAPLAVNFASTASDSDGSIASFLWTFGSDGTSTAQSPAHTFNTAGSYSVTLRVTDNSGASTTSAAQVVTVTANTPPVSSFTKTAASGIAPLAVTFTSTASDSDGSIASYLWTFGSDGTSTTQNPAHTFNTAGAYNVTLRVTDNGGASTTSAAQAVTVSQNHTPTAAFTVSQASGYAPLPVNFDGSTSSDADGDALTYSWAFGDGATASGATTSHSYAAGTYTASLTVTDSRGAASAAATRSITASPPNTFNGKCPGNSDGSHTDAYGRAVSSDTVNQPGCATLSATGTLGSGIHNLVKPNGTASGLSVKFYPSGKAYPILVAAVPQADYDACLSDRSTSGSLSCGNKIGASVREVMDDASWFDQTSLYFVKSDMTTYSGFTNVTFSSTSQRLSKETMVFAPEEQYSPIAHEFLIGTFPAAGIPSETLPGLGAYAGAANNGGCNGGYVTRTDSGTTSSGKTVYNLTAPENSGIAWSKDGSGCTKFLGNIASHAEISVSGFDSMDNATLGLQGGVYEFCNNFTAVGGNSKQGTCDSIDTYTGQQLAALMASNGVVRDPTKSRKVWDVLPVFIVPQGTVVDDALFASYLTFMLDEQNHFATAMRGLVSYNLLDDSHPGSILGALLQGVTLSP